MGVVRREGDWRLNKQEDGVYEVTYKQEPELKIITSDYDPSGFTDERNDFTIPIQEVDSFADAEAIFEDTAQGNPSPGDGLGLDATIPSADTTGLDEPLADADDEDLPDLPPVGLLLVGVIGGGFLLQQRGLNLDSPVSLFGVGLLGMALAIVGVTGYVYHSRGLQAAVQFLISVDDESGASADESAETPSQDKTPPAPESMKDDIYFDRANQCCEWCDERTDSPEIHHITPRSEGGPNEYENLIALCPDCHRKADKGGISQSKLRSKVSRQMDDWKIKE